MIEKSSDYRGKRQGALGQKECSGYGRFLLPFLQVQAPLWLGKYKRKKRRERMHKRFLAVVLVLALALTAGSVLADEPSGTISIKLMSASAVMGASWGQGVLTFGAKTYAFKVKGLKVLSVGVTKASADGDVYKLTNAADLAGTYKEASRAGLTFIKGEKGVVVQNEKGVVINVKATAKGMALGLVEGGLTIEEVK
jgi:hypothetical protein